MLYLVLLMLHTFGDDLCLSYRYVYGIPDVLWLFLTLIRFFLCYNGMVYFVVLVFLCHSLTIAFLYHCLV